MKLEAPPKFNLDFENYYQQKDLTDIQSFVQEADKRYFYWTELKNRPNLPFKSAKKAWGFIKTHRFISSKPLLLGKHHFHYNLTSFIQRDLHLFDLKLIGGLYKDSITQQDQDEYFKTSLIEEAIASSQIEGAATTTNIAREMIKSGRSARNESEQMIINNLKAIQEISTRLDEPLSTQLILDIHELMTSNTEASKYSGKFRDHPIYVKDHITGEIAYTAPSFKEVNQLINGLIEFVNDDENFIHPILKSSILHFLIGYIHPFGDGNGRTARALFYWFLIKKGYVLLKHISISKAILESRTSYDKAFLKTEEDQNDLTYFIVYSMKSLRVAFQNLVKYRDIKRNQRSKATQIMYSLVEKGFNKRQSDLLAHLYAKPEAVITIPNYSRRHDIVRQTASRDLMELEKREILKKGKDGKTVTFRLTSTKKITELIE